MFDPLLHLLVHIGKDIPQRIAVPEADCYGQVAKQQAYRCHILQILAAVVDPRKLHIRRMVIDGNRQSSHRDEELIPADSVCFLHGVHLRLQNVQRRKQLTHLILSGVMVDLREAGPFNSVITVFKILPALFIEGRVLNLFTALKHQIVKVRICLHAHVCLADIVHKHLKGASVKYGVMYVEEHISGFLRLKDPASA